MVVEITREFTMKPLGGFYYMFQTFKDNVKYWKKNNIKTKLIIFA